MTLKFSSLLQVGCAAKSKSAFDVVVVELKEQLTASYRCSSPPNNSTRLRNVRVSQKCLEKDVQPGELSYTPDTTRHTVGPRVAGFRQTCCSVVDYDKKTARLRKFTLFIFAISVRFRPILLIFGRNIPQENLQQTQIDSPPPLVSYVRTVPCEIKQQFVQHTVGL